MPFLKSFEFCPKLGLTHNVGYKYASKSLKGSIDADFDPVFNKILSKRMGQWVNGLGPRAGQRWPKFAKHAFFVTSPPEIPPPKTKNVFFDFE